MYYLIHNGQVAGTSDTPDPQVPQEYSCLEGPDVAQVSEVFFDGQKVRRKPPRPSEAAYWDNQANRWAEPVYPAPAPVKDWDGLRLSLESSAPWNKVFSSASRNLKANSAFTMLGMVLIGSKSEPGLAYGIGAMRSEMKAISGIGDFTEDELAVINQALETHGFTLRLEADPMPSAEMMSQIAA